ncbi:RNA 2',3'-cyclic phosphodiesterase [Massilia niastensis]|uniref:RNA 2',3'-cyclic phosphodiesterase n=1 Tax=Massilia niastensis TaxID=544911 RepID=UPI00037CD529|nr:RNA 2',3'-cyclic phosphodiesterase [Massilia niastensis]
MSGQPDSTRLFLALWPEPGVRHQLAAWRDAWQWPRGAAPVHSDKLHVTLHFLGNLASERLPALQGGLDVPFTPFRLELGLPVLWPRGLAVLEPHGESPELLALYARLEQAVAALGLAPEARKYRPHVTLARRAAGAGIPATGPAVRWDVAGYALVASRDGAYTVLHHYA